MADCAFEDVILSKKYSVDNWIKSFDQDISEQLSKSGSASVFRDERARIAGHLVPKKRSRAPLPQFLQIFWKMVPEKIRLNCRTYAIAVWSFFDKTE